jgi:Arc/MetJ-type ribon-helix-helix transcriptional regulator
MPLTFGEKLKLEPVKITIRLPLEYIEQIDLLVDLDDFPNRSEAIRAAVRDMLYERTDLVLEKMEKKVELKRKMEHINKFRNEYLKQ